MIHHLYHHPVADPEVIRRLDEILSLLRASGRRERAMGAELTRLQAEVAENTTVIGSATILLETLSQKIRDLADDPAALNALADELDTNTNGLATSVATNTPAADEEPPVE